jgi:hypothetical protein
MPMSINIKPSHIWSAFEDDCIGSKCGNQDAFELNLEAAIENHDTSRDRAEGQHFIVLSKEAIEASGITAGVGRKTANVEDYVLRLYRGGVKTFLNREHALPVSFCAVIVYTKAAYLADPEGTDKLRAEIEASEGTHFLVALLANAEGVPSPAPRSPSNLVKCLAGRNNEAEVWTLDEIKEMAKASVEYDETFAVVAD